MENKGTQAGSKISNTTKINTVIGPTHTGSGDIRIEQASFGGSQISTRDEFLAAQRAFKAELDAARSQGIPSDAADDVMVEVEAAERELGKDAPKPDRVVKRLENAKDVLLAAGGLASATTAAAAAAGKRSHSWNPPLRQLVICFEDRA